MPEACHDWGRSSRIAFPKRSAAAVAPNSQTTKERFPALQFSSLPNLSAEIDRIGNKKGEPRGLPLLHSFREASSVAVAVALEGTLDGNVDVVGLLLGQLGERRPQLFQVQGGHLLVQVLGQHI